MSAQEATGKLRELAAELDTTSKMLTAVSRELRPVQREYDSFIHDFRAGLWARHDSEGEKLPSIEMQTILALKEMPAEFRGKHYELVEKRANLKQRISDLKAEVDAWRSVLSAEKTELEAISQ